MMKNYDKSIEINRIPNWSYIPDHLYRNLIIYGLGSDKTIVLMNLIKHQRSNVKKFIYLSSIHLDQSINYLSTEEKKQALKILKILKHLLIIYKALMMSIKLQKIMIQQKKNLLIVFRNKIADMEANKK